MSTSIDFAVKLLGITAYRYTHRSREIWNGDDLQSITTLTKDDGKHYAVRARQEVNGLAVERETPGAAVGGQGNQRVAPIRETLPSGILPSTHWNMNQLKQSRLLNSQKGTEERIAVARVGRETVKTVAGAVDATRYSDRATSGWTSGSTTVAAGSSRCSSCLTDRRSNTFCRNDGRA